MAAYDYAVYKGDIFLFIGTKKECAERLGVKPETIKFYASNAYHKRLDKKGTYNSSILAIRLDDREE